MKDSACHVASLFEEVTLRLHAAAVEHYVLEKEAKENKGRGKRACF